MEASREERFLGERTFGRGPCQRCHCDVLHLSTLPDVWQETWIVSLATTLCRVAHTYRLTYFTLPH